MGEEEVFGIIRGRIEYVEVDVDGSITIIALETTPREFTSVLRHLSTRDSKLNAKFR